MAVNDLNNKHLAERKYLTKLMECRVSLARQGLPFRGNDRNANLTQLFKLSNKNSPALLTYLGKKSHFESDQQKYMHNDIQNELIELMVK